MKQIFFSLLLPLSLTAPALASTPSSSPHELSAAYLAAKRVAYWENTQNLPARVHTLGLRAAKISQQLELNARKSKAKKSKVAL